MSSALLLASLLLGPGARQAQAQAPSGNWAPQGADPTYPRTLLKAQALPGVQASLAAPERLALYQGLWNEAQAAPSTDTSTTGRRARATYAKNSAFVVLLHRQATGGASGLAPLTQAQHDALVASVRGVLESLNPRVGPFASQNATYTDWQWRSKELIDYLIAYDLLRGAGATAADLAASQAKLQTFAGNLYRQAITPVPYFGYTFYGTIKNNHTLMTAAALGMAAVVLSEATSTDARQQPSNWAGAGLYHIDNVLWRDAQRQSDSTQVAGYGEGPYYLKYALLNCLPFFRAMGNFLPDTRLPYTFGTTTRNLRNPYFDPKYDLLYGWLTAILQPDGRLPALADSYVDMGMPELALTDKSQYAKPMYFSKISGTPMASATAQLRDVTVDMRAAWLASAIAPTPQQQPALTVLPASGNLVLRAGTDSLATYLHLTGEAQAAGGGHSQGDASSFILHAYGQLLALDPGYLSYDRRAEVGQATNHNLVLVDGKGPAIGTAGGNSAVPATIGNAFATPQLTYGEVATIYQGTNLTRKALLVRGAYYLLADAVSATAAHTYTWQLHGYGLDGGTTATGTYVASFANNEATWQKNGVSLLAHVTVIGGTPSYSTATNTHETTYNTAENHSTLLVAAASAPQTQFLAALYPYTTQPPSVATTSQAATAALAATTAEFADVAFAQADTLLRADASTLLPQPVSADGRLNFYSARTDGSFAQLFLQEGTVLRVGDSAVVRASRRATISWQRTSATQYDGYVSRPTTLTLAMSGTSPSVRGDGVRGYYYNAARQQLQVELQAATTFSVTLPASTAPLPVELTAFTGQRLGQGVRLQWRTATEQASQGFEVQRQVAGGSFAAIGWVASQGEAIQPTNYTFLDAAAPTGALYYRLRQLDQDGTATYSSVVALSSGTTPVAVATLLPVVPQPAHAVVQVQVAGTTQTVTLRLLDSLGRVVRQQRCQQQAQLEVSALPPGLYYLMAQDEAGQRLPGSQKVIIN